MDQFRRMLLDHDAKPFERRFAAEALPLAQQQGLEAVEGGIRHACTLPHARNSERAGTLP